MNEIIFLVHLIVIGACTIAMLHLGLAALTSFLCVQAILANLFVIKQISLFGFNATASDMYIVGSVLTLNLIQEYYGKENARKAIWISFGLLLFYTVVSQLHLWYLPHLNDFSHKYYYAILSFMPRIMAASITVYLAVQHFDTFFYGFLKRIFQGKYLLMRNVISISVSQLLDTLLFSFLGLYGIIDNLPEIMIVSYTIKLITMLLLTPSVLYLRRKI